MRAEFGVDVFWGEFSSSWTFVRPTSKIAEYLGGTSWVRIKETGKYSLFIQQNSDFDQKR